MTDQGLAASTREAAATVNDLGVTRGGTEVLRGVSLTLAPGSVTLLIGPNGAGKTTLLRALCGGAEASRGSVRVGGRDPRRDRAARRQIGLVPQEIALYGRLTVTENVEVFAALSGHPKAGTDVAQILRRTGLTQAADRLVSTLSGGLQRRANLACALVGQPRLLLLDEPAVGLDLESRRAMALVLRRLAADTGAAILLTTHDLDEAESLADRVAVLHGGRLIADGPARELIADSFDPADRRIDVLMAASAGSRPVPALRDAGFRPVGDGAVWRGFVRLDHAGPPPGAAALGLGEDDVSELRIRRPGLEDAFSALIARADAS